jgi:hypothetical protein
VTSWGLYPWRVEFNSQALHHGSIAQGTSDRLKPGRRRFDSVWDHAREVCTPMIRDPTHIAQRMRATSTRKRPEVRHPLRAPSSLSQTGTALA